MRTSRKEIFAVFESLCEEMGVQMYDTKIPYAQNQANEAWALDYAACYGGWEIQKMSRSGGVSNNVFCEYRMPAGEFVRAMRCAIRCLENRKIDYDN